MSDHTSKNFDLELESLRTRVLQMGGMAEEQVRKSIEGLYSGDQALLESVPSMTAAPHARLPVIEGAPPDLVHPAAGCSFAPRCRHAGSNCSTQRPPFTAAGPGRAFACWVPAHHLEDI